MKFAAKGSFDAAFLPAGLISSALENLLENAQRKAADGQPLSVEVTLDLRAGTALRVCDSGRPVPESCA